MTGPWVGDNPDDLTDIVRGDPNDPPPEPARANEDMLIDRPDLGPGAHTLITAGQPIPPALAGLPHRPAATPPQPATRRRR